MLSELLPIDLSPLSLGAGRVGLVVVDAGVAFTREGNLSDPTHMVPMVRRIGERWTELRGLLGTGCTPCASWTPTTPTSPSRPTRPTASSAPARRRSIPSWPGCSRSRECR